MDENSDDDSEDDDSEDDDSEDDDSEKENSEEENSKHENSKHENSKHENSKHENSKHENSKDDIDDGAAFIASKIQEGDVVSIMCTSGSLDAWSIKLPKTKAHIWLCHVSSVKPTKKSVKARRTSHDMSSATTPYEVIGHFYKGTIDNLVYDKKDKVFVVDTAIVNILYRKYIDDPKNLKLQKDEIKEMRVYVRKMSWKA
jgi:DNA mismatch repair ATPase MutL